MVYLHAAARLLCGGRCEYCKETGAGGGKQEEAKWGFAQGMCLLGVYCDCTAKYCVCPAPRAASWSAAYMARLRMLHSRPAPAPL